VGVLEPRRRFRFCSETLHVCPAGEVPCQDHFYRDRAIQTDLPGLVHNAHYPASDFVQQVIVTETALHSWRWKMGNRRQPMSVLNGTIKGDNYKASRTQP